MWNGAVKYGDGEYWFVGCVEGFPGRCRTGAGGPSGQDAAGRLGSVRYSAPTGHVDTRVWWRVVGGPQEASSRMRFSFSGIKEMDLTQWE
jgi:hypothetical protein